jgi:hypothetical protein
VPNKNNEVEKLLLELFEISSMHGFLEETGVGEQIDEQKEMCMRKIQEIMQYLFNK